MKHTLLLFLAIVCLGGIAPAQTTAPSGPVAPIDVTTYVAHGVNYFRSQASTNEDGWFFHPIEGSKIVGWKTNMVHFKNIEVTIPGYRVEDPYEVMVPGRTPLDPMQRQTRYRTVVRDPSKDHKEMREVPDVNGPIERNWPIAIYEKDEGCRWRYGGLGNNALAVFTLRRCGIRADDPLITQPLVNLAKVINQFGYPDNTYDLAWMTAAFAVTPGDGFKQLTEKCASKLMDAQLTTGPGAGMWGPVAVNTTMASSLLKTLTKLGDEKKAMQKELQEEQAKRAVKGKPSARAARLEEDMAKLDSRLEDLNENSTRITQFGLLMFDVFGYQQWGMDGWGRRTLIFQGDRLGVETLPYLIQNQITADLDSTALVLFALRTAIENGRLPSKTWRPDAPKVVPVPGAPPAAPVSDFPPAREARDVITLAAKALNTGKPANGQWTELNVYQRVTDFAWLKFIPQVVSNDFPQLPQPVNMTSIARGAAALGNIQMMQTGKAAPTALESETLKPIIQDLINERLTLTNTDVRLPYETLFQMTALRTKTGRPARADYAAWNEIADWLTRRQGPSGAWGRTTVNTWVMMPSTSLRGILKTLPPITDATLVKMYDRPHLTPAMFFAGNIFRYGAPEASYFTVASLLYLSEGLPEGWIPPLPEPPPPPAEPAEVPAPIATPAADAAPAPAPASAPAKE